MALKRLFIYPKDIQNITGRKQTYAYKLFNIMLSAYGKTKEQGLTIRDYCLYSGISQEQVEPFIN